RLANEDKELAFTHTNDGNSLAFRLCRQVCLKLAGWNKERGRQFFLMCPTRFKQSPRFWL
ncbi:MAG: hypothetical protein ACYCXU_07755, partial [Thermoleophilia bacterium]